MTVDAIRETVAEWPEGQGVAAPVGVGIDSGEALAAVLPPFLASRLLLLVLTAVVGLLAHFPSLAAWDRWDSRWYLGVSVHGYHWTVDGKPALAFFPLYPLLIHLLGGPPLAVALVVSNVAFFGALVYIYRLVAPQWGSQAAQRALWLVALFPTAFFTFAPYAEAIFMLTAAAALYNLRQRNPLGAGLWISLAILSRPTGVILLPLIPLVFRRPKTANLPAYLLPACAAASYAAYLWQQHFSPFDVLFANKYWHRSLTYPWVGFTTSIHWLVQHGGQNFAWSSEDISQLLVTVVFLTATVAAWRNFGPLLSLYCAGFWVLTLISPEWRNGYYAPFSSMDRIVLTLFPLAGWAASRLSLPQFRFTAATFGAGMTALAAVHLCGGWVG